MLEQILFFCIICLHISNLDFQGPSLASQLNSSCSRCLTELLNEPQINPYHSLGYIDKNEPSFDYHLLPILRQTIEQKIQYAYESTNPYDLDKPFLSGGLDVKGHMFFEMFRKFFNLLREVHLYGKEVKGFLEEQKQEFLKKIAQKVDDITLASLKLAELAELTKRTEMGLDFDFEKAEKSMKRLAGLMRGEQQEAKNAAESLVVNETMNNMKKYSKLISDYFTKYEEFRTDTYYRLFSKPEDTTYARSETSWKILEREFGERTMPKKHRGFEKIMLRFDINLEEFSKEIDQIQWDRLRERVEERFNKLSEEL